GHALRRAVHARARGRLRLHLARARALQLGIAAPVPLARPAGGRAGRRPGFGKRRLGVGSETEADAPGNGTKRVASWCSTPAHRAPIHGSVMQQPRYAIASHAADSDYAPTSR